MQTYYESFNRENALIAADNCINIFNEILNSKKFDELQKVIDTNSDFSINYSIINKTFSIKCPEAHSVFKKVLHIGPDDPNINIEQDFSMFSQDTKDIFLKLLEVVLIYHKLSALSLTKGKMLDYINTMYEPIMNWLIKFKNNKYFYL